MINKTFPAGLTYKGLVSTIAYLLNERVDEGTAKVIDGNVDLTLQCAKYASKKFKRCWSSGVLSFEETISEDLMKEIIALHKEVTFCGMSEEQYNTLYVAHSDKNRSEIHYLIPTVELSTGKRLNPYYVKRDFKKKDLFQDLVNAKYNLSSPKQSKSRKLVTKNKKKWASKKSTIQKEIDEAVSNLVRAGDIQSRDDIIDFLRENGFEINRLRKTSISVKHESIKKKDGSLDPISLKGKIYGEHFSDWGRLEESIVEEDQRARRTPEEIRRELDSIIRSQAIYNAERFKRREETKSESNQSPESLASGIELRLPLRESGREERSDNQKEEYVEENERKIDYVRYRENTERRRRDYRERKRRTLAGADEVIQDVYGSGSEEQRRNIAEIDTLIEQTSTIGEQLEGYAEALTIEKESIRVIEEFGSKIDEISRRIRKWIGRKVEAFTGQINALGEEIEGWLEDKSVTEAKKRNAEKRIKSILVDDRDQKSFLKFKS